MRIENACIFRADGFSDLLLHLENLRTRLNERGFEAPNLVRDLRGLDAIARHVVEIIPHHVNRALGNSRGNACSVEPNFLPCLIAAHAPARITGMSIFVEARVD